MKSNICKIRKGELYLRGALAETEKTAEYNGLSAADSLSLRLLTEELINMLPSIVSEYEGTFWIEAEGARYSLNVNIKVDEMDISTRESLITLASDNVNASAGGIVGKLRAVFDYMVLGGDEPSVQNSADKCGFGSNIDFSYLWSLQQYKNDISEDQSKEWDELEKSIIVEIADDIVVGVKGKYVKIIIKKFFEEN